ncbi:MAG: hypothetical protein HGB35_02840 [Geobacteraceae bacterium]|nr:hypothetical protein [Geobacteraceae bacterium]
MICANLDIHQDELFYSWCARLQEALKFSSGQDLSIFLFGKSQTIHIDFPSNINDFTTQLTPGHRLMPEYIIENHTVFPYYQLFLSEERQCTIKQAMINGSNSKATRPLIYKRARILKYCPICVTEDHDNFGCAIWHRTHQPHEVRVCVKHLVHLETVSVREKGGVHLLLAVDRINVLPARMLNLDDTKDHLHFKVAQLVHDIMRNTSYHGLNKKHVISWIYYHLRRQGFLSQVGQRCTNLFCTKIAEHYPESITKDILPTGNRRVNWRTYVSFNSASAAMPVHFLLLILFLNIDPQEIPQWSVSEPMDLPQNEKRRSITCAIYHKHLPGKHEEVVQEYRAKWLMITKENPGLSTNQLRKKDKDIGKIYNWLYEYDKEWFRNNFPKPERGYGEAIWKARDEEAVRLIRRVSEEIRAQQPPVRVTRERIARQLDPPWTSLLISEISQLPLADKELSIVFETMDDYILRKLWWHFDQFRLQGVNRLTRRALVYSASLHRHLMRPHIEEAIGQALALFQSTVSPDE